MSDADSRDNVNGDVSEQDNICRDFLRNVCRRGKRCKYRHPDPSEAKEMGRKIDYIFCHDYQNKECRRPNCKFIHCTRSEEDYYHATGELPQRIVDHMGGGGSVNSGDQTTTMESDIPICKDYLNGICRRGGCCKFRHINRAEYDSGDMSGVGNRRRYDGSAYGTAATATGYDSYDYYEPERKRRMYGDYGSTGGAVPPPQARQQPPPPPLPADYYILEEENAFLRRKVEELKKQVTEVMATNEFLLDQNAQLRLGKQNAAVNQSLNPNAIAATPSPVQPTIAQMSQQIPMNNDQLAAAAPLQPQRGLTTQELAAATSQSIAPIVPVSLAQGATLAPVSIAPVTLTQAIPAVSLPQSLPQNPLVSYPIMTQSMRPAMPQSSLAH